MWVQNVERPKRTIGMLHRRMNKQRKTSLIHEGQYLAEVSVELLATDDEWSPYLSVEDAYKLDDVREALKNGDTAAAAQFGRVFSLTPIAV
ncbi:MAG: hypothetical protein U0223_18760 [Nitrospira sp.]